MGSGHFRAFYELMISACMSKINRILFGEAAFGGAGPEWGTDWADTDKRMATGIDFKEAPGLEVSFSGAICVHFVQSGPCR